VIRWAPIVIFLLSRNVAYLDTTTTSELVMFFLLNGFSRLANFHHSEYSFPDKEMCIFHGLQSFEKPHGTLLNSANWATGGPLRIYLVEYRLATTSCSLLPPASFIVSILRRFQLRAMVGLQRSRAKLSEGRQKR
jgi:hypothetical protein